MHLSEPSREFRSWGTEGTSPICRNGPEGLSHKSEIFRFPLLEPLFTEQQWRDIAGRLELSRRQIEIVRLIFQDAQERFIAAELGISVHTVHTHVKRLYAKLGATSHLELVLQIVREYLASLQEVGHREPTLWLDTTARRAA